MSKKNYTVVVACVCSIMSTVFSAELGTIAQPLVKPRWAQWSAPQSFYDLVTRPELDKSTFANPERLKCFGDINTRYCGYTPLHILIKRSDATIEQVKALLDRGANVNMPLVIKTPCGFVSWDSYTIGFAERGASPVSSISIMNSQWYNREIASYIFCVMLEQKITKEIEQAKQANKLICTDAALGVIIPPRDCVTHSWPEMPEDEARVLLHESTRDQRELELFVKNLSSGAFDVFLKMQENFVMIAEQK